MTHNNNECNFYYTFKDDRVTTPMKFTNCDCEIISIEDGCCTVKACKEHEKSIKEGTQKYISPFIEPSHPIHSDNECPYKAIVDEIGESIELVIKNMKEFSREVKKQYNTDSYIPIDSVILELKQLLSKVDK